MALARAAGALSRASRRGGGTSFPGKLLLRMDSHAIARLSRRLDRGAIVVSATNGKTTTAGMIAAIRALMAWKPARFTVRLDGRERRFEGYTVAAANTGYYGGGMNMAPGADPSDGLLDVIMIEQVSKRRFLANLPKVFKGTHVEEDTVKVARASEVNIAADRPFDVYADGDPLTTLPVRIRLVRGGLSVIVPRA